MTQQGLLQYTGSPVEVSHVTIIQELLAALVGFTGDVFVDTSVGRDPKKIADPSEVCIQLADDIHWISESQRQILNDLAKLGFHYAELQRFVENEEHEQLERGSVYKGSLVTGVSELLSVYHSSVLQLQQKVMQHPAPVLPMLQAALGDFQLLMRHVHDLLFELQSISAVQLMTGSTMLRALWSGVGCGIPALQSVRLRLLWHCHRVLYRQITAWIVNGHLLDHQKEFFIRRAPPASEQLPDQSASTGEAASVDVAYHEWHDGFMVEVSALPHFISLEVAEALVFIGKAVRVLRQPAGTLQHHELLTKADTLAFSEAMTQLAEQPVFNRIMFERTVESIRTKVAGLLWHLVVVHADLMSHFAAMKDYFLLARGDFFHCFLDEASGIMSGPPRPATADHDVNVPFQQAALKTGTQNHRLFNLVRIRHSMEEMKVQLSMNAYIEVPTFNPAWDNLYLDYHVEWPLGLLITKPVLGRYNALFRFLLRLKRVQLRLENAWCDLCRMYGPRSNRHMASEVRQLFQLRQHMAHFITNLQIYIQVDVIESNYAALEARVAGAVDFVEAERAHARYLNALLTECFLTSKNLCRQIGSVFAQVQELCQVVATAKSTGALDGPRIDAIAREFGLKMNSLYTSLTSRQLQESNKAPHLAQFYLRLNFNDFVQRQSAKSTILLSRRRDTATGGSAYSQPLANA